MTDLLYVIAAFIVFFGSVICMTGAIENRRDSDLTACCDICRARKHSVPTTNAWSYGPGNGKAPLAVVGADPLRATSRLASEGRPAPALVNRAKVDRPTPAAIGTASLEAAGTTGRAAHALRAHAGPPARHLHSI